MARAPFRGHRGGQHKKTCFLTIYRAAPPQLERWLRPYKTAINLAIYVLRDAVKVGPYISKAGVLLRTCLRNNSSFSLNFGFNGGGLSFLSSSLIRGQIIDHINFYTSRAKINTKKISEVKCFFFGFSRSRPRLQLVIQI